MFSQKLGSNKYIRYTASQQSIIAYNFKLIDVNRKEDQIKQIEQELDQEKRMADNMVNDMVRTRKEEFWIQLPYFVYQAL